MSHLKTYKKLNSLKSIIFDCDGVLWLQGQLIPGALDLINFLKNKTNIRIFFVTNNSISSSNEYFKKFQKLGFQNISQNEIIPASRVSAFQMKKLGVSSSLILGGQGLDEELNKVGIDAVRFDEEVRTHCLNQESAAVTANLPPQITEKIKNSKIDSILVGLFPKINYHYVAIAATLIKNKDCKFYATNPDSSLPSADNYSLLPDAAMAISSIQATTKKPIDKVFGKPETFAVDLIKEEVFEDFDPEFCMMVGDRVDTDITFGRNFGAAIKCLVLSGYSDLKVAQNELKNDGTEFFADSVKDILELFQ